MGLIDDTDIAFVGGESLVIIDRVYNDTSGCVGVLKSFVGKYKDWEITFCLYDTSDYIADRVVVVG